MIRLKCQVLGFCVLIESNFLLFLKMSDNTYDCVICCHMICEQEKCGNNSYTKRKYSSTFMWDVRLEWFVCRIDLFLRPYG